MGQTMRTHFQELALECASLWSWQYDAGFCLMEGNCPSAQTVQSLFEAQMEQAGILADTGKLPALIRSGAIAWILTAEWQGAALVCYHVMGPARLADPEKARGTVPEDADRFPLLSSQELCRYAAMLHKAVCGDVAEVHMADEQPGIPQSAPAILLLARLQDKVRNGDPHFKELFEEVLTDHRSLVSLGAVTIDSAKRIALLSLDLCCKTALESGLSEKSVAALQEEYLPQIRAATYGHDIANLCNLCTYHLVRLVRRARGISAHSSPVQAACTYIEEHACEKLPLHVLAGKVGYSPDHLAKKFKEEVGESLKEYILRAKISRAQLMLTTTGLSIGDVSGMLSFCSSSHFTKVFRELVGETPAVYRERHAHV